jgi:hypothetical protein
MPARPSTSPDVVDLLAIVIALVAFTTLLALLEGLDRV